MAFSHRGQIHIDEIEKVEIHLPYHHPAHMDKYLDLMERCLSGAASPVKAATKPAKAGWVKALDLASKIISIVSGLAIVVFLILLIAGVSKVGNIQTDSILTIFGFTLFGGLFSVGGAELFSLSLNLRKAEQKISDYESGCPFVPILEPKYREVFSVDSATVIHGYSDFCGGCPFGPKDYIDRDQLPARCRIYNENFYRAHEKN